ncbi:MAG: glycosyltransferase [Planctomycetota bacterium]
MIWGSAALLLGAAVVGWTWVGYPLLVRMVAAAGSPVDVQPDPGAPLPSVSIVVPVYDAAAALQQKLGSMAYLSSWHAAIEVVVSLDGCTDASEEVAREAADAGLPVRVVSSEARGGKSGAQNRAVEAAQGNVLVLTDVGTAFGQSALRALLEPFADTRVGYVAGNLGWRETADDLVRSGVRYTGWERALWGAEDRLGVLHVAPGAFMAVRRELYEPLSDDVGDDAMIPLDVVGKGYRGVFAPGARAVDDFSSTLGQEFQARVRMTSRSLRATMRGLRRWRLWSRPGLFGAVVSHRLLRWMTPVWLLTAAAGAAVLAVGWLRGGGSPLLALGAVAGGALLAAGVPRVRRGLAPFLVVNAAFLVGGVRAFTGGGIGAYRTGQRR